MPLPLIITMVSLLLALVFATVPGLPEGSAAIWLLAALASVLLLLKTRGKGRASGKRGKTIVVDGSNLLYWRSDTPDLKTVMLALRQLEESGRHPKVWFDANVGYLIANRYLNAVDLAKMLKISSSDVTVASKGEPADPLILSYATRRGLQVLSNDRYRDWHEAYPAITEPGTLIKGRFSGLQLRLEPAFAPPAATAPAQATQRPTLQGERRRPSTRPQERGTVKRREPRVTSPSD